MKISSCRVSTDDQNPQSPCGISRQLGSRRTRTARTSDPSRPGSWPRNRCGRPRTSRRWARSASFWGTRNRMVVSVMANSAPRPCARCHRSGAGPRGSLPQDEGQLPGRVLGVVDAGVQTPGPKRRHEVGSRQPAIPARPSCARPDGRGRCRATSRRSHSRHLAQ